MQGIILSLQVFNLTQLCQETGKKKEQRVSDKTYLRNDDPYYHFILSLTFPEGKTVLSENK